MKRIFTFLFAVAFAITSNASFLTSDVYAASEDTAAEESTKSGEVNLIDSEDDTTSDTDTKNLPDTGAAYDLTGLDGSPDITAESAIVMDARSGEIIYSKQADAKRYPASITKVMTTLLAIENCKMDDIVEFTSSAVNGIEAGSSSAGINVGAKLTVEQTLYALMLVSANEAGAALAEHISGSNEEFAKLMTERAKELGCTNTQFKNPHGLPDEEHYTSAYDMGLIMKEAIKHEEFRKISSTISYTLESDTLTAPIELWNHAKILRDNSDYYYQYAVGAKTGFTQAALNTLVTYAEKDGMQLLCVILKDYGADQSYYDTTHLYKWAFEQLKNTTPLSDFDLDAAIEADDSLTEKQIKTYESLNATFDADYPLLVKKDFDTSTLVKTFRFDEDTAAGRLGYIDVKSSDGTVIYSAPVSYDSSSDAAKSYLASKGGNDGLKTAKVVNKNSLLRKMGNYLLRIAIACVLIYIIMQLIHRWQLEKKRKDRMKKRAKKRHSSYSIPSSVSRRKKNIKSASFRKSSSRTNKSDDLEEIRKRRRRADKKKNHRL